MQINGCNHGFEWLFWMLRQHASNHAGKNVAGGGGLLAKIASSVDPHVAIGMSNQGAMPFEDDDEFVFTGKIASDFEAVFLDFGNGCIHEPRHFSGVRSDDKRLIFPIQFIALSLKGV